VELVVDDRPVELVVQRLDEAVERNIQEIDELAQWAMLDSNQRPLRCERSALTS
jgi:hypothetical protein